MEKVKEMFMKEFKELTSKNTALEYVSIKLRSPHSIGRNVALTGGIRSRSFFCVCPGPDTIPP